MYYHPNLAYVNSKSLIITKDHEFRPYLGFAKNVKEISGPSLNNLPDYYCLLAIECQDLGRNTATMGSTAHFLPVSLL